MRTHQFCVTVTAPSGQKFSWHMAASSWGAAYDAMVVAYPEFEGFAIVCDRSSSAAPTAFGA